jgi:hypothetical protein
MNVSSTRVVLWSEGSGRRSAAVFSIKVLAENLGCRHRSQDLEEFPEGHGGEGENNYFLVMPASFLLASLGGKGVNGRRVSLCAPAARSRLVGDRYLRGNNSSGSPWRWEGS